MPYGGTLGDYTPLVSGTHEFAYNKVIAMGVLVDPDVDYTDPAVWAAFVADDTTIAADVKVIPDVIGSYDGGNPEQDKGYGKRLKVVKKNTHKIDFKSEYNKVNTPFMNDLMTGDNVGIYFITGNSEEFYVIPQAISFTSKSPVTDVLEDIREFDGTAEWSKITMPIPINLGDAAATKAVMQLFT